MTCSRAMNWLFINLPDLDEKEKAMLTSRFGDVISFDWK